MESKKIGNYISKLRKDKGLTQEQLAEKIGVSNKTISKWETGINIPDTHFLYELSKEFAVNVQDILNGEHVNSKKNENKILIDGISFYNKILKKKFIVLPLIAIISIVITFSIIYTLTNYNNIQLYDIRTDNSEYSLNGYLIRNNKETIMIINNLTYLLENVATSLEPKINEYDIKIQDTKGEIVYYSASDYFEERYSISNIIKNINISFNIDNKSINNISSLEVFLIFHYSDGKEESNNVIQLIFDKHFSNNKIIY